MNILRVFQYKVLRRIFGPRSEKVRGVRRKFHNALHNLYSLPDIGVIKSKRGEMDGACSIHGRDKKLMFWQGDHLEDLGINWRVILK
jgi:hypothetical protein